MKKIIIDPITRIEGHLRVEVELDDTNTVTNANVSGTMFRGIEILLQNRKPIDAPLIAQRICGVCTNVHYRASMSAVEDMYGVGIPTNAKIIRDLVALSLFVQDHIVHYYHLHSLDFVDISSALKANVQKANEEAFLYCDNPYRNSISHLEAIKEKLNTFVSAGRLGIFAKNYSNHGAYKFNSEQNLIHMSHYFEALRIQKELGKAIAIFGGKTPHPQYMVLGGVTCVADMLNPQRINDFLFIIRDVNDFINRAYMPDMKMLCHAYKDDIKAKAGYGLGNFMCVGGYSFAEKSRLFETGVIKGFDLQNVESFDETKITEEVTHSWYKGEKQKPLETTTDINYTDYNDDGSLKSDDRYSWIKSPRYDGISVEVGPLARMIVGYAKDSLIIKPYLDKFMKENDMQIEDFCSYIGRNIARAIEADICCEFIFDFVNDLLENIKYYNDQTCTRYKYEELRKTANGRAFFEVPRGVLSHFVNSVDDKIVNYQVIAPTTWNASPRDENGKMGAYESALVGLKVLNPDEPIEVLRVIRSFDPCIACAVHIVDSKGRDMSRFKV